MNKNLHKILSKNIHNINHRNNSLFKKCQIFVFINKVFKKRIQKALCEFASK